MELILWWSLVAVLILIGVAGMIFPILPNTTFLFAGMWLAAWLENYQHVGTGTLIVLGVLTALSFLVDYVAAALGVRRVKASRAAVIGATIGSLVGVVMGLWGLLIFPFIGAVLGELMGHRDHRRATEVGFAAWVGVMLGLAAKIAISFAMLGIFAFALYR
ncbi:DUF456 domain-containing protein [Permianibacter aggregans]|uniref:DUF456 domain-containing protein n=1 Tax=Permianibacter aggregans TaxID=1510150 RepID=A0A4R6UIQ7_9GAMM|nr:DUF456 domain-containing protein [Permianibacter aggregans]QGX38975.1 DUF456 domain-containing protein [Permianibacter aggregans]TDQ46778.1 hypothetical protein EV696_11233 [Permianibacter aggregans]